MPHRLHLETFTLGDWYTNCYVLHAPLKPGAAAVAGAPCWVVDAGFNPEPMIRYIRERNLVPRQILLTHAHLDHIGGLASLRAVWPETPILIHAAEKDFLADPELNLSVILEEPLVAPPATGFLEHGQKVEIATWPFEVRHTPGHSPGGVTFHQGELGLALVGDTLFAGGIGRSDFPTSDPAALMRSIREQLLTLPDATRIHPGHGPASTIGAERRGNPFL